MAELYKYPQVIKIYEAAHYSHLEHVHEVDEILSWYKQKNARVLDIGCSGGLHALELAKRGFNVTGIDIERSAVDLAIERNETSHMKARFLVCDIEIDDISPLGLFGFIYSIGNVMSHMAKTAFPSVLEKIRRCLDKGGIFLFDVLTVDLPFQEEIFEKERNIFWRRRLHQQTDMISMDGQFLDFRFSQHFGVWG